MAITQFALPTAIHFGAGARKLVGPHLLEAGFKRPLIVTDRALGRTAGDGRVQGPSRVTSNVGGVRRRSRQPDLRDGDGGGQPHSRRTAPTA